jgi:hypothetical protein
MNKLILTMAVFAAITTTSAFAQLRSWRERQREERDFDNYIIEESFRNNRYQAAANAQTESR